MEHRRRPRPARHLAQRGPQAPRADAVLTGAVGARPDHGQFFNWYDPATGARLTTWPADGSPVYPFLSTVDNGWLAAALLIVARAEPRLHDRAMTIERGMDFGLFYDPASGHLYGGAWTEQPPGCSQARDQLFFTCHRYDTLNTEPRIASYLGIAQGSIPPEHYYRQIRAFGPSCDWAGPETQPVGTTRTYRGVDVFEGIRVPRHAHRPPAGAAACSRR